MPAETDPDSINNSSSTLWPFFSLLGFSLGFLCAAESVDTEGKVPTWEGLECLRIFVESPGRV